MSLVTCKNVYSSKCYNLKNIDKTACAVVILYDLLLMCDQKAKKFQQIDMMFLEIISQFVIAICQVL